MHVKISYRIRMIATLPLVGFLARSCNDSFATNCFLFQDNCTSEHVRFRYTRVFLILWPCTV